MKSGYASFWGLSLLALTFGMQGCATAPTDRASTTDASATAPVCHSSRWTTGDLVFKYRQQAAQLRNLASSLELEAEYYAEHHELERAKQTRQEAKHMRAAADLADERARECRQQMPHNQVY